jgi:hypothetical protein
MCLGIPTLRTQVEQALAGRVAAPFTLRNRQVEMAAAGIPEVDALVGGLPRGSLTEIYGPSCSGRTSLLLSALYARTVGTEACALIDGCDAFDPLSAAAAGIDLKQLLWVRCHNLEQSFRATDYLLQAGGFGFIALDLSDIPPESVRRIPLDTWFRFRRAVEGTSTILLVLEQEPHAKTCASLVLHVQAERSCWKAAISTNVADFHRHPFSFLLDGSQVRAELIRSKLQGIKTNFRDEYDFLSKEGKSVIFDTHETHALGKLFRSFDILVAGEAFVRSVASML